MFKFSPLKCQFFDNFFCAKTFLKTCQYNDENTLSIFFLRETIEDLIFPLERQFERKLRKTRKNESNRKSFFPSYLSINAKMSVSTSGRQQPKFQAVSISVPIPIPIAKPIVLKLPKLI